MPLAGIVCHLGGWPMVVGPCPLGNMTGSEVTETYGLFDKTVMLAGRLANSKKSDLANQIYLSVCVPQSGWLLSACCLENPRQGLETLVNLNAQLVGTSWD